jgi:hypothetical protein
MWFVIRLIAAATAFFARLLKETMVPDPAGRLNGLTYYEKVFERKGQVRGFRIGLPLRVPIIFRLQEEGIGDRLFKALGLAKEFQSGDDGFDRRVYVAGDHPALFEQLAQEPEARKLVAEAIKFGFKRVSCDGNVLWLEYRGSERPSKLDKDRIAGLHTAFAGLSARLPLQRDRFFARVVAVEAIVWSIAAYAGGTLFEWFTVKEDVHVDPDALAKIGIAAGVAILVVLFAVIVGILGRSSRGHRILIEGAVVLALSLPIAGIGLVSDVNRVFDTAPPDSVSRFMVSKTAREHRGRRGRRYYTYHIDFGNSALVGATTLPRELQISEGTYNRLPPRGEVTLLVGRGWAGLPWYRGFSRSRQAPPGASR